jgi:hypothetical protein
VPTSGLDVGSYAAKRDALRHEIGIQFAGRGIDPAPGAERIRGAAGSGKTTTAVLRLRHVSGSGRSRTSPCACWY